MGLILLVGEISSKSKEKCEMKQANFDKLLTTAQTLSDLLDEDMPDLINETENVNSGAIIENLMEDLTTGDMDPWKDEETKSFYTDLPDLRQFLPNFSAPKIDPNQIEDPAMMTEEALLADIENDTDFDDPPSTSSDPPNDKEVPDIDDIKGGEDTVNGQSAINDKLNSALRESGRGTSSASSKATKKDLSRFLLNLNNCINKELIDSAAIEFLLNYNTRNNRKKLTKSLISVHR